MGFRVKRIDLQFTARFTASQLWNETSYLVLICLLFFICKIWSLECTGLLTYFISERISDPQNIAWGAGYINTWYLLVFYFFTMKLYSSCLYIQYIMQKMWNSHIHIYIYICRFFHYIKTIQTITIRIKGKNTIGVREEKYAKPNIL